MIDDGNTQPVVQAMREDEARLHAVVSSLDDLVFEIDEYGTYLGIWTENDALLAAPRSELLGRTLAETISDEVGIGLMKIIGSVLASGRPEIWEYHLEVPAGVRWFESRVAPIVILGVSTKRVCLLVRDITEQKAVEQEVSRLLSREQLLSRLAEALPVGLFELDRSGSITFDNDRMREIVGHFPGADEESTMSSVIAEDRPILESALATVLANRPVDDLEIKVVVNGIERICEIGMRPLTDSTDAVIGAVGYLSDVTYRAQIQRELEVKASVDALTSCLNRAASLEFIKTMTAATKSSGEGCALIYADLDDFKSVNDRLGHAAGDRLLVATANRLRDVARKGDAVGRLGGDEFLVICPQVDNSAQAVGIAERVAAATKATIDVGLSAVELRTSVGVAWTTDAIDADAFLAQADSAMYESKRTRREGVTLFSTNTP
jgi:diguanylate cyclase (GGDEF)-like protein/PAS domain S-box-containing protein